MIALSWILGIVGLLGVAGTIVAIVLIPAVAVPILQNIVSMILRCRPCLFSLALIGFCLASWWFGHHQAVLQCRASELQAELRNKQIDLDNANKAASDEADRAKTIEEKANARQQDDADYIAHLEGRPACVLDDNDIGGVPDHRSRSGRKKPAAHPR